MNVKELFLTQKQTEHQGTMAVYGKIPPDRLAWRPAEGVLTLGQMARHVWLSEQGFVRTAIEGDWGYSERRIPQGLLAVLGEVTRLEDELNQLQRVHEETMRAAEAFPLELWNEIRENPKFNLRWPAGVILFRIIEHQVHHRAQVGTYLRLLSGVRASPYPL